MKYLSLEQKCEPGSRFLLGEANILKGKRKEITVDILEESSLYKEVIISLTVAVRGIFLHLDPSCHSSDRLKSPPHCKF